MLVSKLSHACALLRTNVMVGNIQMFKIVSDRRLFFIYRLCVCLTSQNYNMSAAKTCAFLWTFACIGFVLTGNVISDCIDSYFVYDISKRYCREHEEQRSFLLLHWRYCGTSLIRSSRGCAKMTLMGG